MHSRVVVLGVAKGALFSEVSSFQSIQEWYLGWVRCVLFREVSSFQSIQEWYLGWQRVPYLERCPQSSGCPL